MTVYNQASYCTAALVSLNNSLVNEKTKFQQAQAKFGPEDPGTDQV